MGAYQPDDLVRLLDVAAELRIDVARLRAMARRGQFPELLRVTAKHALVRRADLEQWKAGRWTSAENARSSLVLAAVRGEVVNRRRAQQ